MESPGIGVMNKNLVVVGAVLGLDCRAFLSVQTNGVTLAIGEHGPDAPALATAHVMDLNCLGPLEHTLTLGWVRARDFGARGELDLLAPEVGEVVEVVVAVELD